MIPQTTLKENYSISRLIKGGWQLSEGHSGQIDRQKAVSDMFDFVNEGITTFDCADIYTNVEDMIGQFLAEYRKTHGQDEVSKLRVHTKFVPDISILSTISKRDAEAIIDRSLKRLGQDRLDVVQFHWWDFDVPKYVEVVNYLKDLQRAGKIENVSLTNFDILHLKDVLESGVSIFSNQIQYSVLDHRPEHGMKDFCTKNNIKIFCYGTVAGGFISEKYLGVPEPKEPLENRSLTKYKLIIDDLGGWDLFQEVLKTLAEIGRKHNASLTNIATKYVLDQEGVSAIIVGARNTSHIQDNNRAFDIELDEEDNKKLNELFDQYDHIPGDIYSVERIKGGKHAGIMKYNLNSK